MESMVDRCRRDRNSDTSNHLRELLRLRQDEAGEGDGRNVPSRTLGSVLYAEKRNLSSVHSNRTLLDIIREDSTKDSKKPRKHFKDKLRLKRAGAAWTSSVHIPASDVPMQPSNCGSSNGMNNRMMMRRESTRIPSSDSGSIQNPATSQPPMLQRAESGAERRGFSRGNGAAGDGVGGGGRDGRDGGGGRRRRAGEDVVDGVVGGD